MNARQKAKHYKKLYEQAKVPYNTVYFTENTLDHYAITSALTEPELREIKTHSLNCEEILTYRIADQLEKKLQHFIEYREEPNNDRTIMYARLDFWVRKDK